MPATGHPDREKFNVHIDPDELERQRLAAAGAADSGAADAPADRRRVGRPALRGGDRARDVRGAAAQPRRYSFRRS